MTPSLSARFTARTGARVQALARYRFRQARAVFLDLVAAVMLFGFCLVLLPILF